MNTLFPVFFVSVNILLFHVSLVWATTIDVYAEGGYTDTMFTVDIYADIEPDVQGALVSAGVKLLYPIAKLGNPVASKNEKEWYFGTPENVYAYIEPETASVGEVVFLLGKLDQNSPQEGVQGDRIHLGRVAFDRISDTEIPTSADLSLFTGKSAPFVNFATVKGDELDDFVNFSISPIVSNAILNIRGVIRILHLASGLNPVVPLRATEMDMDNDGVVGIEEAIRLLQDAAD